MACLGCKEIDRKVLYCSKYVLLVLLVLKMLTHFVHTLIESVKKGTGKVKPVLIKKFAGNLTPTKRTPYSRKISSDLSMAQRKCQTETQLLGGPPLYCIRFV